MLVKVASATLALVAPGFIAGRLLFMCGQSVIDWRNPCFGREELF
jgi:hypothetical protein